MIKTLAILFALTITATAQTTNIFPALTVKQTAAIQRIVDRENATQTNIVWTVATYYRTNVINSAIAHHNATLTGYVAELDAFRRSQEQQRIEAIEKALPNLTRTQLNRIITITEE